MKVLGRVGRVFGARAAIALLAVSLATSCDWAAPDPPGADPPLDVPEAEGVPLLSEIPDTVPPPPPEPVKMPPPAVDKEAVVSILGYHDFTDGSRATSDMVIHIDDFRAQMQLIKDRELPVISMQDYLAWRRDETSIPDRCVMITIDDGWKATHTLALPVLKEFGYPFTIFLYRNYVGSGGARALTFDEVRELMAAGATVGSHSVSHTSMIVRNGLDDEGYDEWLKVELEDSYQFLAENFGSDGEVLKVFAYPFGIYSDYVVEKAESYGYEAAFTVNGAKTRWDTPSLEAPRYIVYGKGDLNFEPAMTFRGDAAMVAGRHLMEDQAATVEGHGPRGPLVVTYPTDGESITERRPVISLDVSKLEGVDPASIEMRVTGFGRVLHSYDEGAGMIRYQLPMSLRTERCGVQVRLRHAGKEGVEEIAWSFSLDRIASYLEGIDPGLMPSAAAEETVASQDGGGS